MKRTILASVFCATVLFSQNKVKYATTDDPVDSVWRNTTCGGLHAQVWSDEKGWHEATCFELADKLSERRDVRAVSVTTGPDIVGMLTYSQYEKEFRIKREDFEKAQTECRRLLKENYAHPDILAQCRKTIMGVVPYGLQLK